MNSQPISDVKEHEYDLLEEIARDSMVTRDGAIANARVAELANFERDEPEREWNALRRDLPDYELEQESIDRALAEARRVLKPGGRFLCLEFSRLAWRWLEPLYDRYSFDILPAIGQAVAGDRQGVFVTVAGAGGAAHLPGMLAAWTLLPVFGVDIRFEDLVRAE